MTKYGTCHVANQHCTAAGNFEGKHRVAICYRCGLEVCTSCSSIRKYRIFGNVRLCDDCQIDEDGSDIRVTYRVARKAGYDHKAALLIAKMHKSGSVEWGC